MKYKMENDITETKEKIIRDLEGYKIKDINEARELCEEYGWEVTKGKWFLECDEDRICFDTDKELIDYAELLKNERED